jgi:hypothetical protein
MVIRIFKNLTAILLSLAPNSEIQTEIILLRNYTKTRNLL